MMMLKPKILKVTGTANGKVPCMFWIVYHCDTAKSHFHHSNYQQTDFDLFLASMMLKP